jgi:hypothetical protein
VHKRPRPSAAALPLLCKKTRHFRLQKLNILM